MALPAVLVLAASAYLPAQNPRWPATYNMSLSSISMMCNRSDVFNYDLAAQFGIPSFDWSNQKTQWAVQKPMDCEERLRDQAVHTKARNPDAHVFVYRNLVKALPWFTSVREKLDDPAYSGFFLKFKDGPRGSYHVPSCDPDGVKCSEFYHDQEQTPAVPTPDAPNPDGACTRGGCDCGTQPCGEYLWDHRNGTMLREFLINEHIFGANGLGHADIDGLFIDDFWCANELNGTCNDPVQGPSEVDANSQADMGLSDADITDITRAYLETFTAMQDAVVTRGKYTWSLIPGQTNANAMPNILTASNCKAFMQSACAGAWEDVPLMYGVDIDLQNAANHFPHLNAQVAGFLIARGPYAYIGYGVWGMSWPYGVAWDTQRGFIARPKALDTDYGVPEGACEQPADGVFRRQWSKATVTLDCNAFEGGLGVAGL